MVLFLDPIVFLDFPSVSVTTHVNTINFVLSLEKHTHEKPHRGYLLAAAVGSSTQPCYALTISICYRFSRYLH